jgi:hypothetical protein
VWSTSGVFVARRHGALVHYDARGKERHRMPLASGAAFLPRHDARFALLWGNLQKSLLRLEDGARLELRVVEHEGELDVAIEGNAGRAALGAFLNGDAR